MDGVLLVAVAALCVIGTLLVWSSTRTWAPGATGLVKKHVLNVAIGAALCSTAAMVDHRWLRAYAPVVYLVTMLGLILVITPVGSTVNGSHSWILLGGGFAVQPSEFAKVGLVLLPAMLMAQPAEGTDRPRGLDVFFVLVATGIAIGLVMLQPDLGTAMVLGVIAAGRDDDRRGQEALDSRAGVAGGGRWRRRMVPRAA